MQKTPLFKHIFGFGLVEIFEFVSLEFSVGFAEKSMLRAARIFALYKP